MKTNWSYITPGISDDLFVRGKVPMTKEEIRTITISKLRIEMNDVIVDIGAGTGSISIEAALLSKQGKVYAVEKNKEGIKLIKENSLKFKVENIIVVEGVAPEVLSSVPLIDKAVIGGTGGKIEQIFDWLDSNLKKQGRVAINVITLENLYRGLQCLKKRNYDEIEVIQVAVSRGKDIGNLTIMQAQNPVYIISASKGR